MLVGEYPLFISMLMSQPKFGRKRNTQAHSKFSHWHIGILPHCPISSVFRLPTLYHYPSLFPSPVTFLLLVTLFFLISQLVYN